MNKVLKKVNFIIGLISTTTTLALPLVSSAAPQKQGQASSSLIINTDGQEIRKFLIEVKDKKVTVNGSKLLEIEVFLKKRLFEYTFNASSSPIPLLCNGGTFRHEIRYKNGTKKIEENCVTTERFSHLFQAYNKIASPF